MFLFSPLTLILITLIKIVKSFLINFFCLNFYSFISCCYSGAVKYDDFPLLQFSSSHQLLADWPIWSDWSRHSYRVLSCSDCPELCSHFLFLARNWHGESFQTNLILCYFNLNGVAYSSSRLCCCKQLTDAVTTGTCHCRSVSVSTCHDLGCQTSQDTKTSSLHWFLQGKPVCK